MKQENQQLQQNEISTQKDLEQPKKSLFANKWLFYILVTAIIGFSIPVSIFIVDFIFSKLLYNSPTPPPVVQQIIKTGETPQQTQEQNLQNWKTYGNKKYGFKIKYPVDWRKAWEEKEQEEEGGILFGQRGSGPGFSPLKIGMTIQIYKTLSDLPQNKSGIPLDEWVQTQYASLVDQPEETIRKTKIGIGEYTGWRIEVFKELGVTAKTPYVYIEGGDGAIFEFEGFIPSAATALGNFSGNYNYQKVFDQMLTTFLQEKGVFSFRKEGDRLIVENGKIYKINASKANPFDPEQTIYFADNVVSMMIVTEGQTLRFVELQGAPEDVRTYLDELSYFADVNTLVLGGKFGEGLACTFFLSEQYLVVDLRENAQQNQKSFGFSSSATGDAKKDTKGEIQTFESAGDTFMCRKECLDESHSFLFNSKKVFAYFTTCSNDQKETTLAFSSQGKELFKNTYLVKDQYLLRENFFEFPIRKNITMFSELEKLQFTLDGLTYQFDFTANELAPIK